MNIQNNEAMMAASSTEVLMANPRFQALVRARTTLGVVLTVVMLAIYYGFILLVAFDHGYLGGVALGTVTSRGLVIGFGVLCSAFILVAIYVAIANTRFDAMTRALREEIGQ